jgi:sulfide dehydrogenase cytochrome subunit
MRIIHRSAFCLGVAVLAAGTARADLTAVVHDCEGCHGPKGVSAWPDVPTIAGISSGVHADYLLTYREKGRPCPKSKYRQGDTKRAATDMCAVAGNLTEADIEAVAAHFDTQPFVPGRQTADATKAAAGRRIHSRDCEACHSDAGRDAGADASILAGQWMPYLQLSLAEFASGNRPQLEKMKEKLDNLSAADLEALVHFYGSQQ